MKQIRMGAAAAVLMTLASGASALTFQFSFFDQKSGSTGVIVEGLIAGLTDNATTAASSVKVTSNPDGFGLGEYVYTGLSKNSFTVAAGAITSFDFLSFGDRNGSCCSLGLTSNYTTDPAFFGAGLSNNPGGISFNYGDQPNNTLALNFVRVADPGEVPLPAALPLLLAGLGALGVASRKSPG